MAQDEVQTIWHAAAAELHCRPRPHLHAPPPDSSPAWQAIEGAMTHRRRSQTRVLKGHMSRCTGGCAGRRVPQHWLSIQLQLQRTSIDLLRVKWMT